MTPKSILTVVGSVLLLEGIGFFLGAESITKQGFQNPSVDAITIGTLMHEAVAAFAAAFGLMLLVCRSLNTEAAKKLLLGAGIGLLVILCVMLKHIFMNNANPPMPAVAMQVAMIVAAFYGSKK